MATYNSTGIVTPPFFLIDPGQPLVPWEEWIEVFENYLVALNAQEYPAERKKAILLSVLGREGQRIFKYLPNILLPSSQEQLDVYTEAKQRLQVRFEKDTNVVLTRYKFYTQPQRNGECIDDFVTRLRELSLKCQFGSMCDEMIRDQLIVQCYNRKIQERLWAAKNPTLKEAVALAKVIEQSEYCMNEIQKKEFTDKSTCEVGSESDVNMIKGANKNKKWFPVRNNSQNTSKMCMRCGSNQHSSDFNGCYAWNKECLKCGRKGHYARVCRSRNKAAVTTVCQSVYGKKVGEAEEHILCVGGMKNDKCSTNENCPPRPLANFTVNSRMVTLMVDSGSWYTILPREMFLREWPQTILLPSDIEPVGYQGERIDVDGYMHTTIEFEGRKILGKVYIAQDGPPILGWRHQFDLHIKIDPRALDRVTTVEDLSLEQVLEAGQQVFKDEIGKLKGYKHKIVLQQEATPVQHKLRKVPIAARG